MTPGAVAHGAASALVLAWMLFQLARRPRDPRLRAIASLVACWTLSWPFGQAAAGALVLPGLDVMSAQLIHHILRAGAAFWLVIFFVYAARPPATAHRVVVAQAVPLVTAVVVMLAAAAAIPTRLRDDAAALTSATGTGPLGVAAIGLFYVTANVYMGHAFAMAWLWTHRRRAQTQRPVRRALSVAEVGLACIVTATALLVAANVIRWAGSEPPAAVTITGVALLLPGFVIFLAAVTFPAFRMRLRALRLWGRHRRRYQQLRPLSLVLNTHFPEDVLEPLELPVWRERLLVRGVRRRYYRRFVECRDGLLRLSPYLARVGYDARSVPTAAQVTAALRARADGTTVADQAVAVAPPEGDDHDTDAEALVRLARQLADNPPGAGASTAPASR